MVETIRLSASDNVESSIQIGSNIAQPRETNFNGRGSSRSYERKNVGTLVNVTPHGQGDKVALQIRYESSRFGKSPTEDAPAEILTATWNATLVVEPGKPTLVGSISSDKSTLLIVNVHK